MTTVRLTKYCRRPGSRPSRKRKVETDLSPELAQMAEGLSLSCEVLTTGEVVLYAQPRGSPDEGYKVVTRIAQNGPGPQSPKKQLAEAIEEAYHRKKEGNDEKDSEPEKV